MLGTVLYIVGLVIALVSLVYLTRVHRKVAHMKHTSKVVSGFRNLHVALSVLYIIIGVGCISAGMSQSVAGGVFMVVFIVITLGIVFATYIGTSELPSKPAS